MEAIGRRARLLAAALGWDVRRLLAWSLCHCVLEAYRSWSGLPLPVTAEASAGSTSGEGPSRIVLQPERAGAVPEALRVADGLIQLLKEQHHTEGKRG
ncbi:hypothetical protein D3C75_1193380 [compost metagenome]